MILGPIFCGSLEKNMNESSKSYLYGNLRLSAAEWRANLDNTDTAETLQSMQDIDKNAEWLRAYLQENDTPREASEMFQCIKYEDKREVDRKSVV